MKSSLPVSFTVNLALIDKSPKAKGSCPKSPNGMGPYVNNPNTKHPDAKESGGRGTEAKGQDAKSQEVKGPDVKGPDIKGPDNQETSSKPATAPLEAAVTPSLRCHVTVRDGHNRAKSGTESFAEKPIRLDAALAQVFPDLGLRGRRRLWEWCDITVNGKARAGGFMVRDGDNIAIIPRGLETGDKSAGGGQWSQGGMSESSGGTSGIHDGEQAGERVETLIVDGTAGQSLESSEGQLVDKGVSGLAGNQWTGAVDDTTDPAADKGKAGPEESGSKKTGLDHWLKAIKLVAMTAEYLVFYKPAGLHTARLAGGSAPSLEACLPLFMKRHAHELDAVCLHQGGETQGKAPEEEILAENHLEGHSLQKDNSHKELWQEGNPQGGSLQGQAPKQSTNGETGTPRPVVRKGADSALADKTQSILLACPVLLTRLDYGTSGLVLAARTSTAEKKFRELEALGKVEKTYMAIVEGMPGKGIVKNALDMEKRRKTAVLPHDGHSTRWTAYETLGPVVRGDCPDSVWSSLKHERPSRPCGEVLRSLLSGDDNGKAGVEYFDEDGGRNGGGGCAAHGGKNARDERSQEIFSPHGVMPLSLVRVGIHRGARHQIRAHLSSLGHPLFGDVTYGGSMSTGSRGTVLDGAVLVDNNGFQDDTVPDGMYENRENSENCENRTSRNNRNRRETGETGEAAPGKVLACGAGSPGTDAFYLHYGYMRMPGLTAWVLPGCRWNRWRLLL